jgi:hypothetical protein
MLRKSDMPLDITSKCYVDYYDGNYCLFYQKIPMIVLNYQFITEDVNVRGDYIDYGEDEKGYTILIDVPSYQDGKLIHLDHVYYGLFRNLVEFEKWLKEPTFLY